MTTFADPPFSVRWKTKLDWFFSARVAAIVDAERVVCRCGDWLVILDSEDGRVAQRHLVNVRAGDGTFLHLLDGMALTDYRRRPERLTSVAGIDYMSGAAWHHDFAAIVSPSGSCSVPGRLTLIGSKDGSAMMYSLEAATGNCVLERPLPWGAQELLPFNGGWLVRSQTPDSTCGLYWIDHEGESARCILKSKEVWVLMQDQKHVLTLSTPGQQGRDEVCVLDAKTLAKRWSQPCDGRSALLSQGDIYAPLAYDGGVAVTAWSAESGVMRWRSGAMEAPIERIYAAGPWLFVRHPFSTTVVNAEDGSLAAVMPGAYGPPAFDGDGLLLVGNQTVYFCDSSFLQ
jgi:hypothetical protein